MRITTKGQVTIPRQIREHLGLLPNTGVRFLVAGDSATLQKVIDASDGPHGLLHRNAWCSYHPDDDGRHPRIDPRTGRHRRSTEARARRYSADQTGSLAPSIGDPRMRRLQLRRTGRVRQCRGMATSVGAGHDRPLPGTNHDDATGSDPSCGVSQCYPVARYLLRVPLPCRTSSLLETRAPQANRLP